MLWSLVTITLLKSFVGIVFYTSPIRNAFSIHKLPNIHFWEHFLQINHNQLPQRSPNFLDAGPNLRSYQHPRTGLLCVWKNQQHAHHHSRLLTGIAIYFNCSETCLPCDLWNWFFCYIIVVVFGSMLDAAIGSVSCSWNSVSTLGFTIVRFRNELFAKINASKHPNQFWARFEILGDTLCKAVEAFFI